MISFGPNYHHPLSADLSEAQPTYEISLGHDTDINQVVLELLPPPPKEETDHLFCSAIHFAKQSTESAVRFLDEYPVVDAQTPEGGLFVENPNYAEIVFDSQRALEERYCAAIMLNRQLLSMDFADLSGELTEQDPRYQAALRLIESRNLAEVTLGSLALYGLDRDSRMNALSSVIFDTGGQESIDSEGWKLAVGQWVLSASSQITEADVIQELAFIRDQCATGEMEDAIDRILGEGVSTDDIFFRLIKQADRCCSAAKPGSFGEIAAEDKLQFVIEYASKAPGSLWIPVVSAFLSGQNQAECAEWDGLRLQSKSLLFDKGIDFRARLCCALIQGYDRDVHNIQQLEDRLLGTDKDEQLISFAVLSRVEGDRLVNAILNSDAFLYREDSAFAYSAALLIDQMRSRFQNPLSIIHGVSLTKRQIEIFVDLTNSFGRCPVDDILQDYFERRP